MKMLIRVSSRRNHFRAFTAHVYNKRHLKGEEEILKFISDLQKTTRNHRRWVYDRHLHFIDFEKYVLISFIANFKNIPTQAN